VRVKALYGPPTFQKDVVVSDLRDRYALDLELSRLRKSLLVWMERADKWVMAHRAVPESSHRAAVGHGEDYDGSRRGGGGRRKEGVVASVIYPLAHQVDVTDSCLCRDIVVRVDGGNK
jgi:hypothetical protein